MTPTTLTVPPIALGAARGPAHSRLWLWVGFAVLALLVLVTTHGSLWGTVRTTPDAAGRHIGKRIELRDLTVYRRVDGSKGVLYLNIDAPYPRHTAGLAISLDECPAAYRAAMELSVADGIAGALSVHRASGIVSRSTGGKALIWIRRASDFEAEEPAGYSPETDEPGGAIR